MQFQDEIVIDASIDEVWAVYSDVERWPEWTTSVSTSQYVAGDSLNVGARVRIKQPRLPATVWEVQAVEPGREWTWVAKSPGAWTTAVHTLAPVGDGATRVRMTLEQHGPVGAIVGRVYASLTRTYLATEAAGLKQRSEAHASA